MSKNSKHILFKTIGTIMIASVFFAFLVAVSACSDYEYVYVRSEKVCVTVADGSVYTSSFTSKKVNRGSDIEITLYFVEGFVFDNCDYSDYTIEHISDNVTKLVLLDVKFPVFLNIDVRAKSSGIYYDANGGITSEGKKGYLEWTKPSTHPRPNTSIGINDIKKDGCTLKGWNTSADGSGIHIGLGSRVTIEDGSMLTLYAEWAEWTEPAEFIYETTDDGLFLTRYTGNKSVDSFVIPSEINGTDVIGIGKDFAPEVVADELVLPAGIKRIEDGAFSLCAFNDIYFFNDIERISDRCFPRAQLKTLHLNAATLPRYLDVSEPAEFADKMDRLILSRDEKKLVFFSGCSMSYGLDSEAVAEQYPDYTVLNMGTMGGTNADLQIDCILPFLGDGDIFIHAPEEASKFQLFYEKDCDKNFFLLCEGNPDLASYIDLSETFGVLSAFDAYNGLRLEAEPVDWTSDNSYHNAYGDVVIPREELNTDEKHGESEYTYELQYLTDEALSRMCDNYGEIYAKGVTVLFGYAPLNYNSLSEEAIFNKDWERFAAIVERKLKEKGYAVISEVSDYLMKGRYFYDTDYHLNEAGRAIRTEHMLNDLEAYFEENCF